MNERKNFISLIDSTLIDIVMLYSLDVREVKSRQMIVFEKHVLF